MSRYPVQGVLALGVLITSISGAGVVAVFSDTATTFPNTVETGEQPHSSLQIGGGRFDSSTNGDIVCFGFVDDLQTPLIAASSLAPGTGQSSDPFCLKNNYSGNVSINVTVIDLSDVDIHCTGDEAVYDSTCIAPPDLPPGQSLDGELSPLLRIQLHRAQCSPADVLNEYDDSLTGLQTTPRDLGSMSPGEVACFGLYVRYPATAAYEDQEAAQTDMASWRFAFTATGAP
jgi:predicted ribosomally synthesized peptide with SipW-like signal peptide